MGGFIAGRIIQGALSVVVVTVIVFLIVRLAGDPAILLLPPGAPASPEYLEQFRESLGLNDPLIVQYGRFAGNALRGDFGVSTRRGRPAMNMVLERVPATAELAVTALVFALLVGTVLGSVSAYTRGSWTDQLMRVVILFGQAFPNFWLGIMLILIFAVNLQWFPPSGRLTLSSVVLPAFALSLYPLAQVALVVRGGLIEVLGREFILVGRSKGISEFVVLRRHALKHVAIPVITLIGLQARNLLAGSIIVETVFAWPGLGFLMIQAVDARDFPVIQATVFFIAVTVVIINITVDLLYAYIDPRIRLR